MAENMSFLPKAELLTLEELARLCSAFSDLGISKIRLTGGEPLVRRNVIWLIREIGKMRHEGRLEEVTITTNGSQLERFAPELVDAGVRRVNVSLDTLDPEKFGKITRWGRFDQVMRGVKAAAQVGLSVKINAVALKGVNETEFDRMITWCGDNGFDLTLIETMPMGEIDEDRVDQYLPLSAVRRDLEQRWTLTDVPLSTGGPARYVKIAETGQKLGLITPLTHNFCESCNRARITCTGTMFMCLGQEDQIDLRSPLRSSEGNEALIRAIREVINRKPKGHDFVIERDSKGPSVPRHMSVTGG